MIQEKFLKLNENDKCPYTIEATTSIEPGSSEDPDELYRMAREGGLVFDVVFYPDRVEVLSAQGAILIGDFKNDRFNSARELWSYLESLKPHLQEARYHGV